MRSFWKACLDLLFPPPPRCYFCQRPLEKSGQICLTCLQAISHLPGQLCLRCGRPALATPCGACQGESWAFTQARNVGPYEGELRSAVHRLKFRKQSAHDALVLARLMFQAIEPSWWAELDGIVPVPLHRDRLRERGFNQAKLLAYELSLLSKCPLQLLLERRQHTSAQVGLSRERRQQNVSKAFVLIPGSQEQVHGKRFLLVDDVLTTGSTLDACARTLRQGGCQEVRAVTVAITNIV